MPKYMDKINKDKNKERLNIPLDQMLPGDKLKHYTLNLPSTLHPTQLRAIEDMARCIVNNEPFVNIHLDSLKDLLRYMMLYRNILYEFDEGKRWSGTDENFFQGITSEYKPLAEAVQKEERIVIKRLDEI